MTISERLFKIMEEKGVSTPDLSRMTGISRHTIFDWHKKNTNPGADKIMILCEALQITPEDLLIGKSENNNSVRDNSNSIENIEIQILENCKDLSESKKKRLLAYASMLVNTKEKQNNK